MALFVFLFSTNEIEEGGRMGILFIAWVLISLPSFVVATFASFVDSDQSDATDRYAKKGGWWTGGLVICLIAWKQGVSANGLAFLLAAYVIAAIVLLQLWRRRAY